MLNKIKNKKKKTIFFKKKKKIKKNKVLIKINFKS